MKAGDIIGWCGQHPGSIAINLGTGGLPLVGLSHVGILAEYEGELAHWECTDDDSLPCLVQGRAVQGTQVVRLRDRLASYHGRAWHYPLYRPLYEDESRRLTAYLLARLGAPYDYRGAVGAGGPLGLFSGVVSLLRRCGLIVPRWAYFCSYEVAGAVSHVGLAPTDDPKRWSPNRLVRHLRCQEVLLPRRRLK